MRRKISQRQARRTAKLLDSLQTRHNAMVSRWATEWPGGVHIDTISVNNAEACIVETATKCGHVGIVKRGEGDKLNVYAVKP